MDDVLLNPALKEWAVAVTALRDGRQIIDLRKGGIHEQGHRFRVRAARFWLYSSYEHQRPELLRSEFASLLAETNEDAPPEGRLRFEVWVEIVETASLTEPEQVAALDGFHIWTPDYAVQRFRWRPNAPLLVLVLRTYRLATPLDVPVREPYAGCASWVPMLDLPADPTTVAAAPALSDEAFERECARLHGALPGLAFEAPPAVARTG